MEKTLIWIVALSLSLGLTACGPSGNGTDQISRQETRVSAKENGGWISLLEGNDLSAWKGFNKEQPGDAWKIMDGVLYLDTESKKDGATGGDLITKQTYGDFHLRLEWKISENGNSGVMFHVQDDEAYGATYETGPEYQLLHDEGHPDGKIVTHRSGDLYDLIESTKPAANPVGEWNSTEIIVQNGMLEFFLNGVQTVKTSLWDQEWEEMVAKSKFKDMPGFANYREGHIALQDHGDKIWFRDIMIKEF